ncbi:hypothetical protein [Lentzea nigeriaca]|uniref:hypothetical protein n=1 Tax=Lentzea nigeriaca TaxID=1128665 RepID=UPI00195E20BD|nr:hypothetical protein [Lentzea nigeriaca]MBM7862785.1 hypothetical protein [Lentzea nigeriaca]
MISRNPEHTEIVTMAGPLVPVMVLVGLDPVDDVEKLNINYDLYAKGEATMEAVFADVRNAANDLDRLRDEVGARWEGSAAGQFDRYAERVVVAGAAERSLIDAQDKATTDFFKEVKKNIQDAHGAIMDALSGALTLANPAMGVGVEIKRWLGGTGEFPDIPVPTDLAGVAEIVIKALGNLADLPKKFGEAKIEAALGPLALRDTADFRIAPDYSQGAVPTGLDGNEKNAEAWNIR